MDRMERTQRLNEEREERAMSRFLEESARSTERLAGQIFAGLRSLLPQPTHQAPKFSPFYAHQSYPHTYNYPLDRPRSNESATHDSDQSSAHQSYSPLYSYTQSRPRSNESATHDSDPASAHQSYSPPYSYTQSRPRSNESDTHDSDYCLHDLG